MNLINKKLLQQKYTNFEFPTGKKLEEINTLIDKWQRALKDSDLENTKEKSIQGKFLQTFFEDILNYDDVTSAEQEYTLIQHPRIENNVGEPDGSLGFFTKDNKDTRVVIELKDAKTDLDKKQNRDTKQTPVDQAFNYASKEDKCKWIIVSNFKEIRLYSKSRSQEYFERFMVLDLLDEQEFKRFYFLLSKDNLIKKEDNSVVDVLSSESNQQEQDITNDYYTKYKEVRLGLLNHLLENNKGISAEVLLEKTQKLLDRIVFTLFCEDTTELLPYEIVKNTYERALSSFASSDERVWNEFKGLFKSIDEGNARVTPPINAYNGGLFKKDEILDNLIILDSFWKRILELADYDYQTDINVNILGHIFEQSISDLEKIKEEVLPSMELGDIESTENKPSVREKKGRRKKEGIFYTPEYITKYIVDNTVGRYIEENPDNLGSIKILDPACGSGAFLNQAHSYLKQEYARKFEEKLQAIRESGKLNLEIDDQDPATLNNGILLNNLFGVDLNKESVEITKLALWLKTAKNTQPLQNLDNNIKCGNSLISDKAIAGDKAFDWEVEFREIIEKGGFDVIIANPPYIFTRGGNFSEKEKDYYYSNYELTKYQINTYVLFLEKALNLLKTNGYLGFIVPNTWLTINSMEQVRSFILEKMGDIEIVNIYDKVFKDANVDTCLLICKKSKGGNVTLGEFKDGLLIEVGDFLKTSFNDDKKIINISASKSPNISKLLEKINKHSEPLSNFATVSTGLKAYQIGKGKPVQTEKEKKQRVFHSKTKIDHYYYKYLEGKDVCRYKLGWSGEYLKYGDWLAEPRKSVPFDSLRILVRQIPSQLPYCIQATLTDKKFLNDINSMVIFNCEDCNVILGILNSKLVSYWFANTFDKLQRNTFPQFKVNELKQFPVPKNYKDKKDEINKNVNQILDLNENLSDITNEYKDFINEELKSHFNSTEFITLGWNNFSEMLDNQKIKLSTETKEELHTSFKKKQAEVLELQTQINILSREIDYIMYSLYGLTSDEINLIEDI